MRRSNRFLIVLGLLLIAATCCIWITAPVHVAAGGAMSSTIVLLIVGLELVFTGVIANLHERVRALEGGAARADRNGPPAAK